MLRQADLKAPDWVFMLVEVQRFGFSPQSLMFLWNTQNNEKALLRGSRYGAWDLLTPPRHSGRVPGLKPAGTSFGPESTQFELGHTTSLDSGQKHAGMTARGLCKSPSRDLFSEERHSGRRENP